ncbi:MAG: metallophosphoesterase family protein [Bacteroidota bacterium]
MKKIGLLSDTHGYIDEKMISFFSDRAEVWHAGDFGADVNEELEKLWLVRGVYGNIDGQKIRTIYPENNRFTCEGLNVWMTHIGGYPGNYDSKIRSEIQNNPPGLFICGHSHILKVIPDKNLNLLHINPGAAGKSGFHIMRTMVRFQIENGTVRNLEVIELGKRSSIE